ncbi:hypothetical protein F7725_005110 [Dissostichus mawsoni]|uniref:Uncharacterized protein n=1 Tax=Dissostichus mawsoni TaxID=36200 RepID=A0A7J5YQN7_DISMA|nr:hypothetical protein F7725_005110 [Dissostichus mawsoni]
MSTIRLLHAEQNPPSRVSVQFHSLFLSRCDVGLHNHTGVCDQFIRDGDFSLCVESCPFQLNSSPIAEVIEIWPMMWSVVMLLATALGVDSYAVHDLHERLAHGRQLKIYLPKSAEKLEFISAEDPRKIFMYWEHSRLRTNKGRVSGTGSDRRWYIDKVTYEDEGTYIQRDFWNKEITSVKVAVHISLCTLNVFVVVLCIPARHNYVKRVAGESLIISLEGIDLAEAGLSFSGEAANVTLVRDGAPVSQDLPNYWDRVQTHSINIEIRNVNYSDEGHYTLRDRRDRMVSITRMDLTDHHNDTEGNPLLALLLLLGIPAGICCCCRKNIFKKKAPHATMLQVLHLEKNSPHVIHPPPCGPVGPAPPYNTPGQPGVVYYHGADPSMSILPPAQGSGTAPPPFLLVSHYKRAYLSFHECDYPSQGFNPGYAGHPSQNPSYPPAGPAMFPPAQPPQWNGSPPGHPPQNPSYPPAGPAMFPPAQPPQWNGSPPGQYPPGPAAQMGYASAPAMYSAPPAAASEHAREEVKTSRMAASPADPLLTAPSQSEAASSPMAPVAPSSTNILSSADDAFQFKIERDKNSTSFL